MFETSVTRRAVLGAGVGVVGLAAVAAKGGGGNGGGGKGGGGKGGGGKGGGANPLYIPPVVGGATTLISRPVTGNDVPGQATSFLGYSRGDAGGTMPGPTIEVVRGGRISAAFHNELDGESTVHWHGMVVPTGVDGQPHEAIPAGGSFTYDYVVDQRATMNWYHPHPHGHTAEQVAMGLAGAVIIRDDEEAALPLPPPTRELPLVIRDADVDGKTGALLYKPRSSGYLGKRAMVNGTLDAVVDVEPAVLRLRMLNGANGRVMQLACTSGVDMTLIGVEGGLLPRAWRLSFVDFSMAERLDVLVDLRGHQGEEVAIVDQLSGWTLLRLQVGEGPDVPGWVPADGAPLSDTATRAWTPGMVVPAPAQTFSFDGMAKINGREFEMGRVDSWIDRGSPEVWRFTTGGNGPHPVHVHGEYFQVVSGSGGRRDGVIGPDGRRGVFPWEDGLKDTVLLQDGETVDVMVLFDAFPGYYLMHCHKLEHEDAGMMLNLQVVDAANPATPDRPMGLFPAS